MLLVASSLVLLATDNAIDAPILRTRWRCSSLARELLLTPMSWLIEGVMAMAMAQWQTANALFSGLALMGCVACDRPNGDSPWTPGSPTPGYPPPRRPSTDDDASVARGAGEEESNEAGMARERIG